MKRIAFICLSAVLLAVIAYVGLVLTLPRAHIAIHAVGLTGEFRSFTNDLGSEMRGPAWLFAVTNTGTATGHWVPTLQLKAATGVEQDFPLWQDSPTASTLSPGQASVLVVTVPADKDLMWRGSVEYWTKASRRESKLLLVGERIPVLRGFFPSIMSRRHFDVWHSTTNVITVH
jgi:hypothetical protein